MLGQIFKDVFPVRLVNRTDNLYIAVMSEDDQSVIILHPGEWTYRRGIYGIDGFAAYAEANGFMNLVNVTDGRGVSSVLWKTSNAIRNGNHSVTKRGNGYFLDRNATAYSELDGNEQRYFSALLAYRNMTKNEMLAGSTTASANGLYMTA